MNRDEMFDKYYCNSRDYDDCENRDCEECRKEFDEDFESVVKEETENEN